jgi:formylglycine-generating enzyme required for sulfatase activity
MGCVPQDEECFDEEKPLHTVTLSPFFIDRHEALYEDVVAWLNTLRDGYIRNPYFVTTEDGKSVWTNGGLMPVALDDAGDYAICPTTIACNDVDWPGVGDEWVVGGFSRFGAELYCAAQGKQLPTEAQWEYAARGPTYSRFPGTDVDWMCAAGFIALCEDMSCDSGDWHWCIPQGSDLCAESVFGAQNMLGGAAEWVADLATTLDEDYSWCEDGCTDPPPLGGVHPILRGGGSCTETNWGRISSRAISVATDSGESFTIHCAGVRCVRPDTPSTSDAGADGGT